jgi:hypothetical protein
LSWRQEECHWNHAVFESHSPVLVWTFYYDQTETHGGKKYSILIICIDEIPNLHQIGELCTVHKRTHVIFMNSICNPCWFSQKSLLFNKINDCAQCTTLKRYQKS